MSSLARRHRERTAAAQLAAAIGIDIDAVIAPRIAEGAEGAGEYAVLMVTLQDNLRTLSETQSVEARGPKKAEFAKTFAPWIEGVLAAAEEGTATQDEVVVTNMIWAIDYHDFDYALDLAAHVLKYGLQLPERYNRTPGCLIAEEIAEIAKDIGTVSVGQLQRTIAITAEQDMPDQARAKLHKALGRALAEAAEAFDPQADNAVAGGKPALVASALDHLRRALALNDKAGVKKDIEVLTRKLDELGGMPDVEILAPAETDHASDGDGDGADHDTGDTQEEE